ncbi:MAG TPA: hypothetical protein QGI71_09730 [Dehalococcoidia bacterium]|nr:hypothetical protein [Dehalococcoidia bacterium]
MPDGFDPVTIESRIRSFESFGIHRTGWPGDDQTSSWLISELEAAGIAATTERFTFPRVEHRVATLRWPDGEATGVPFYDAGATPASGTSSTLGAPDDDDIFGRIVVATNSDDGFAGPAIYDKLDELQAAGVVAVVLVSGDEDGDILLRNGERIDRPHPLPVLQVPVNETLTLISAVFIGAEATVEIEAERLDSTATNVIVTLPGEDPDAAPVGVMTPKSGWFTCAAERGGGLVIWLGLAEALNSTPHRRPIEFVASSGHEIHHYGLRAYIRARSTMVREAAAWLHLGASIGAQRPMPRMAASDQALHDLAVAAFEAAGSDPRESFPVGTPGGGEAREIHAEGGRYVSLMGGHPLFHSPNDTTDRAVDPESVSRHARASLQIVEDMLKL